MRSIGFIGTESSHVDDFIRFLNLESRHPGFRAGVLVGGRSERNETLAALGGIDVVEAPKDLVGHVDAAIISSRDGARHRAEAEPLLAAGIPLLVDKPLAAAVIDAEAIIAAAVSAELPLVSCSALRFAPEIAEFTAGRRGALRQLSVIGPADPDSEHSGLFFYGIHHVETALEILGNPVVLPGDVELVVWRHGDTTVALTRIADVDVVLTFVTPSGERRVPFYAVATHTDGILSRELTLGLDYNAPTLERFVTAVETGALPIGPDHLLSPIVVLAAITDVVRKND